MNKEEFDNQFNDAVNYYIKRKDGQRIRHNKLTQMENWRDNGDERFIFGDYDRTLKMYYKMENVQRLAFDRVYDLAKEGVKEGHYTQLKMYKKIDEVFRSTRDKIQWWQEVSNERFHGEGVTRTIAISTLKILNLLSPDYQE